MEIKSVPIADLVTDPANARRHDTKNLEAIRGSLSAFDQVEPLIVQRGTNVVIGGNGRLEAMKKLGWTDAKVHYVDFDHTKARALGISLNRTGELADWDNAVLGETLESLRLDGIDLGEIGFSGDDLETMADAFTVNSADLPDAVAGDEPFVQQMAFAVTADQKEKITEAIKHAQSSWSCDYPENSNKNGNALYMISLEILNER
jgi:ParB-like chromosome segregation protein Spo0J